MKCLRAVNLSGRQELLLVGQVLLLAGRAGRTGRAVEELASGNGNGTRFWPRENIY